MNLLIDTTQRDLLVLGLYDGHKKLASMQKEVRGLSENLLPELENFLKKCKVNLKNLTEISVNPGPGGFSSTRTGVATANALAYALGIPVAEFPSGKVRDVVRPKYDQPPHIPNRKGDECH